MTDDRKRQIERLVEDLGVLEQRTRNLGFGWEANKISVVVHNLSASLKSEDAPHD